MNGPLDVGLSGGDMHAIRLAEHLDAAGDAVAVVAPRSIGALLPDRLAAAHRAMTTPLDGRLSSMPIYTVATALRALQTVLQVPAARVDVATTHFFFDVLPAAARRRLHGSAVASYVYHLVGESERPPGLRSRVSIGLETLSLRVLRRVATVVFVDNDETHAALLDRGFSPAQLAMTRNAYDPPLPLPAREPASPPEALFVGRLVEVKGVWDAVELARALRDAGRPGRVVMIGDGPLRGELERRCATDGLERHLELPGFVDEAEKWQRLRRAAVFVSPSREEGWGIAVGEALFAEVPALVYDLPAYRHFGGLPVSVPLGDTGAFVATALELLEPARAEAERARVGRRHDELPRWRDVLAQEAAVLHRVRAS